MKTYATVDHMFADVLQELSDCELTGSRDGKARQQVGWAGRLEDPASNLVLNPARDLKAYYAAAELIWYLGGYGLTEMIEAYAPSYKRFAEDGFAHGAYGWRWHHNPGWNRKRKEGMDGRSQLHAAATLLREKPETRQCVVTMWDSGDLWHALLGDKKDLPCTLALQFVRRGNFLDAVAFMRSNDAWLGLPYDVFCFTSIQRLIADELGLSLGQYVHCVGSMHLYERDAAKAVAAVRAYDEFNEYDDQDNEWKDEQPFADYPAGRGLVDGDAAAILERDARYGALDGLTAIATLDPEFGQPGLMRDCVLACWGKLFKDRGAQIDATAAMADGPLRRLAARNA